MGDHLPRPVTPRAKRRCGATPRISPRWATGQQSSGAGHQWRITPRCAALPDETRFSDLTGTDEQVGFAGNGPDIPKAEPPLSELGWEPVRYGVRETVWGSQPGKLSIHRSCSAGLKENCNLNMQGLTWLCVDLCRALDAACRQSGDTRSRLQRPNPERPCRRSSLSMRSRVVVP